MKLYTYLDYGGNCRQAFESYVEHLGGQIFMPMAETLFADRFAMPRDRFATSWMLLHERAPA